MKKIYYLTSAIILALALTAAFSGCSEDIKQPITYIDAGDKDTKQVIETQTLTVERIEINSDKDNDGKLDLDDILEGARIDADNMPVYKSAYYQGGYPPENEGVCTDVVWRAFWNAGYNLKAMVDKDIKEHTEDYPNVKKPDPNIDFRRVKNLYVFFKKYSSNLTLELKPNDIENLKEWQGGDIVTFSNPDHIAIISDKRRPDGIPYIVHNAGPYTREADDLLIWMPNITGHFRYPKK